MKKIDTIGDNIRFYRESKGLTISALAEMINISEVHLGAIERGKKKITSNLLIKILIAFDMTFDELTNRGNSQEYFIKRDIMSLVSRSNLSYSESEYILRIAKIINRGNIK